MSICPVCGSNGEDLIFKFYCSNPNCQNYDKSLKQESMTDDITKTLHNLWKQYNNGETEEEFLIKFFANGGRFSLIDDKKVKITEPEWLKRRKERK